MARYAKIDRRIWNDARFNALSERAKLLFLFLLTHPNLTMLGAMRATEPGLAAELRLAEEAFREAFREALAKGLAKHDAHACIIWLPNFLRYNRPESPNVVRSWPDAFDLIPECELKSELFERLKDFVKGLSEGFGEAFAEAFPKGYAESVTVAVAVAVAVAVTGTGKERSVALPTSAPRSEKPDRDADASPVFIRLPLVGKDGEHAVTETEVAELCELFPAVDVRQALRSCLGWNLANPKKRKTGRGVRAHIMGWMTREQDRGGGNGTANGKLSPAERRRANNETDHEIGVRLAKRNLGLAEEDEGVIPT